MGIFSRRMAYTVRRLLRTVLHGNDSSRQIAAGVGIGVFIAFTPTMGFQMIIAALVTTVLKCSRLPAMVVVYITNPFTAIPIYGSCYALGVALLRPFGFRPLQLERIRSLFVRPEDVGFWETMYTKLQQIFALGGETFLTLWLGCVLVGAAMGVASYYVSLRFVAGHRLIKAERAARRARRRLERVRLAQALEHRGNAKDSAHDQDRTTGQ